MQCLEFRRAAGADPRHLDPAAREHAAECPGCAEYLRQTLALDERILAALKVPVAASRGGATSPAARSAGPAFERRRWLAFAASIVVGVLVGTLLWVGGPRESLAVDLVQHLGHEPEALVTTTEAEDGSVLAEVLGRAHVRLRPAVGTVSYANSCFFRGHRVPHLVVQTATGPVTVMVLPDESVEAPVRFSEDGYSGTIVPAGPGSVAVIGEAGTDLEQVTGRVLSALEWVDD